MLEHYSLTTYLLPLVFFIVAFIYSSVGLGGGSTYTALMALIGMSAAVIPMVSLSLNLAVTTIGSINFIRHGHARLKLIAPFLISSIPMAYVGGSLNVPAEIFYWVLLLSLSLVAARIYFWESTSLKLDLTPQLKVALSLISGGLLGLIAGIAGIGGGVYLVPLVVILGLGSAKEAAACGAIFVWLNSLSGLTARWQFNPVDITDYLPLLGAVLIGGMLGSFMGARKFSAKTMEKLLGIIVIVASLFLMKRLFL